jgi:DNA polymerase-3 subunit gamma/tau
MDKFIVSARKYRPQNFSTVIGQSHITTTLKNAINNNQLAHAFLFCGPRGVGKTTCARILAKTINCEKKTKEGEACNKCSSCVSFDNSNSFNIHELDAASRNGVDDIKELIDEVRIPPQAGNYKVYIIDEVHMLSPQAFNAFLKTLEEPPPYVIFILATTEKHKILPTILSRCQIFDFKRITINDTVEHLEDIVKKENITAEKTALHFIAQKSEGCLRDALSILDKITSFTGGKLTYANTLEHLNILDEFYYFTVLEQMQQQQLADAMLLFDEINLKGFEGDTFLEGFADFIRNLLVCKDSRAAKLLEVADEFKPKYIEYASKVDTAWLISALNILSDTLIQYKQTRNKKLHVELFLIKLCYLKQAVEVVTEDGGISKKKIAEQNKAVSFKSIPFILAPTAKSSLSKPKIANKENTAILIVEEPQKKLSEKNIQLTQISTVVEENTKIKLGSLSSIRKQINSQLNTPVESAVLNSQSLNEAWESYINKLNSQNNHSAATNFKMAELSIIDQNTIEIITESKIQQKFIEGERAGLTDHLQSSFKNKFLKYSLKLIEKVIVDENQPKAMNTKEHFANLSEQFPLVKVLKEKLKLDLEF